VARPTRPRSDASHGVVAAEVLRKHASLSGQAITLPVPIEAIVEQTYGITVLYDEIEEPPGSKILGALSPADKTIVLNARHEQMLGTVIGPERFTYAHELGHWIYDAEDPNQASLDFDGQPTPQRFCRDVKSVGLERVEQLRETNANKLAAHLLLPEALVRRQDIDALLRDFRGTARRWGVSQVCLRIRLEDLGLLTNEERIDLLW
jgi:Zn-dependent peptidase ImmA (M78 family)